MSSSERTPARLIARASAAAVEITVTDSAFRAVSKGIGEIAAPLPPGIYQVRFQAGTRVEERFAVVGPTDAEVIVDVGDMPFPAPVPLAVNGGADAAHAAAAARLSRSAPRRIGSGSRLLIFARAFTASPAAGMSLRRLDGSLLADVAREGESDPGALWSGCHLELDPGDYRLRREGVAQGTVEQIVTTTVGWLTLVFVLGTAPERPDASQTSILLAQRAFDPDDERLRWAELLRQGLAHQKSLIRPGDMDALLAGAIDCPMLGLYAGHLLLLDPSADRAPVAALARELARVIGPHPDVRALALASGVAPLRDDRDFAAPPMLRSSWLIVSAETGARPALVPACSLSAKVATRLYSAGPWLHWRMDWVDGAPSPGQLTPPDEDDELDDLEEALLDHLMRAAAPPPPARLVAPPSLAFRRLPGPEIVDVGRAPDEALVRALGVPWACVQRTMRSLRAKLEKKAAARPPR